MKSAKDFLGIIVFVFLLVIALGILVTSIRTTTERETITDTFLEAEILLSVPHNLTLSGNAPFTLTSVSNGTTVTATNYTDYITDGFLQVDDNSSFSGDWTVTYIDSQEGYLSGSGNVLLALIPLLIIIAGVLLVSRKNGAK